MLRYFDPSKKCLVYIDKRADTSFWEKSWSTTDIRKDILSRKFDPLVVPTTKRFLPTGSSVLEGGCGKGEYVYLLTKAQYKCAGVDTAKKTIFKINRAFPELKISVGDVRKLKFPASFFNGYWSLGVIEHFFKGYEPVIREAYRVISPGGYFFLIFPYLSLIRRLKIRLGSYPVKRFTSEPNNFYQFLLDPNRVILDVESHGFKLVHMQPFDGFKGFKDEVKCLAFIFLAINNWSRNNRIFGAVKFLISVALAPFSGHNVLVVFQKNA